MRDQCEGGRPQTRLHGRQGPEKTHQGWEWQRASQSLMWESQAYGQGDVSCSFPLSLFYV